MKKIEQLNFCNSYSRLPDEFFSQVNPTPLKNPFFINLNTDVAELLELDVNQQHLPDTLRYLSGQSVLPQMKPLAQCYAGHQFGHFVPRLGDGRAISLGEIKTSQNTKWDLQIKGGGQTAYSRDGDGRAVLRSTIREYLCSEAMHALGIETTRALCIIGSEEEVYREQIETGALLLRTAPSHVRFGSFEYFYYSNQHDHLDILADHVIDHHYPSLRDQNQPYLGLLETIIDKTASMIAQWQSVGFAHGVMNTDNMSVLGLTLDYGPFGFLDAYDPSYICNHSDHQGRYAFNKQPDIGLFNVSCLAQAMLPVLDPTAEQAVEQARHAIAQYNERFISHYASCMRSKLGLQQTMKDDQALCQGLLDLMEEDKVDYTILFRRLCHFSTSTDNRSIRDLFIQREKFDHWSNLYRARLEQESTPENQRKENMKRCNPKYILRNYMAEIAIRKAEDNADYSEIELLLNLLKKPFEEQDEYSSYADFPPDWAGRISVSCSS